MLTTLLLELSLSNSQLEQINIIDGVQHCLSIGSRIALELFNSLFQWHFSAAISAVRRYAGCDKTTIEGIYVFKKLKKSSFSLVYTK